MTAVIAICGVRRHDAMPAFGYAHEVSHCRQVTAVNMGPTHVYRTPTLLVLTTLGNAEYHGANVPTFHVSVSVNDRSRRASDDELDMVRRDFHVPNAEEDNHSPGPHRNLFIPVHLIGLDVVPCECKTDETTVIEPDGYTWSKVPVTHTVAR